MIYPSLLSILVSIVWIVFGTSRLKLNPFIVLLSASLLLGFLLKIPIVDILILIKSGFLKITENIGLLIVFGTIIGVILEKSNGTIVIASNVLKYFSRLPLPFAVSIIGYIVSIPVFCDAAFVILSRLNKTLANQTKTPLVGLTVALSTGLFAPHVLIPPTPGPLAAASNLDLKNIFLLIAVGSIIGFILILVGAFYGNYLLKRNKYEGSEPNKNILNKTNFQIQAIILSNLGSGVGLSYKLNNNLWFSLEQQTSKGTMSRNTNGNSNREDSDFDTRTVYANLRYYLTDILDELSFQTGLIYRDWEAKSLIIDNSNEQRKGVYTVMYPENGYNFGLGLNWFYTNGLFSSLNFVKIITNEPSVEYELEGDYECNLSCQEDFEAKVDKYSPTNLLFLNIGFSF